jgi:hypothetical protein
VKMVDDQSIITEIERLRDPAQRLFELEANFVQYTKEERDKEFEEWKRISGCNDVRSFTRPILVLLRQHPILGKLPDPRFFGSKQLLLSLHFQLDNILRVAIEQGAEAAVAWLHRVANIETADLRLITEVHGLETDEQHTVRNGVKLMPLDKLPPSQNARSAVAAYNNPLLWMGHPINFLMLPIAAMLLVPQVPARGDSRSKTVDDASQELRRTILAFTLASKHAAPVPGTSWIEFVDPDLARAEVGRMYMGATFEGTLPQVAPTGITSDALMWVDRYLQLRPEVKNACDVAIERLNLARRRRSPGDQAIEGGICLEALLLGDSSGQEITYKLKLRAALLLASTLQERRKIVKIVNAFYDLRSKTVHGQRPKAKGLDRDALIAERGLEICAKALGEIVQRNRKYVPQDWELSGGEPLAGD